MKTASAVLLCLLIALARGETGIGQEPRQGPALIATQAPPCGSPGCQPQGLHWTLSCFPRCGCADDYCPHPCPPPCQPPYPPFYRCVPAGDYARPGCGGHGTNNLSWWFLPTPRALREALWCQP
jgi:hypothetical protein